MEKKIKEIQDAIKAVKAGSMTLSELETIVGYEEPEAPKLSHIPGYFEPEEGEDYCPAGGVHDKMSTWDGGEIDQQRLLYGMCHATKGERVLEDKRVECYKELIFAIREANGEWVADFENSDQLKYGFQWDHGYKEIRPVIYVTAQAHKRWEIFNCESANILKESIGGHKIAFALGYIDEWEEKQ